jgi:type I restriction enzyme S subunit
VPFINAGHLGDGVVQMGTMDYISPETFARLGGGKVQFEDVLLCIRGSLGRVALADRRVVPAAVASSLLILRATDAIEPRFLLGYFMSPMGRAALAARDNGSAQPNVGAREVAAIELNVPPIPTQRKIAAILSAYDDLVENNSRRIKILEETARRIYREWFVDYRYPGHQKILQVDSELGPVPKGWAIAPIGDYALVQRGRSYRGSDLADDGGVPFVNLKCVARDGGFRPDGIKRYIGEYKALHQVRSGEIVMAVTDMTQERRIVARAARVPPFGEEVGVFSMDLVKIVAKGVPAEYLYAMLRYSTFADEVKAHANGANVLHLHPDRITSFRAVVPPRGLMARFAELVAPMDSLGDRLGAAQSRLRAARDLLLPRLVSGEIDVDDVDIQVPDAA